MKLREIKARIMQEANAKCKIAEKDYFQGCKDCEVGIFDKWFRYNREDDGEAYAAGWYEQNKTTMNEKVKFIAEKELPY